MPTDLLRFEILLTKAQARELRLRFPDTATDKAAIYSQLGFDPPQRGGIRPGAGWTAEARKKKGRYHKPLGRPPGKTKKKKRK